MKHKLSTETYNEPEAIYSEYADDPDLVDLIEDFTSELENEINAMKESFDQGNYDKLRSLAHQIKGAGGSYGYQLLTDVSKVLEKAATVNDTETCMITLKKLTTICQAIVKGRMNQI